MKNLLTFINDNITILIALLSIILGLVKAIISKNKQKIYTGLYDLIGNAEVLYTKGPYKFDYVFKNAYNRVPKVLRYLISEDDVRRAIEYSLNKIQAYADTQSKAVDVVTPVKEIIVTEPLNASQTETQPIPIVTDTATV